LYTLNLSVETKLRILCRIPVCNFLKIQTVLVYAGLYNHLSWPVSCRCGNRFLLPGDYPGIYRNLCKATTQLDFKRTWHFRLWM